MQSYDYARRTGVLEISWEDLGALTAQLTERVALQNPHVIVGIARGGLFPATAVASMLRLEFYPVRLTRRVQDRVIHRNPKWKVPLKENLRGKCVVVIDEIADSGQTLALAAESASQQGAFAVVTACLFNHSWAKPIPDISIQESDALVIFPWDRQVYVDGKWVTHPELIAGLKTMQDHKANQIDNIPSTED